MHTTLLHKHESFRSRSLAQVGTPDERCVSGNTDERSVSAALPPSLVSAYGCVAQSPVSSPSQPRTSPISSKRMSAPSCSGMPPTSSACVKSMRQIGPFGVTVRQCSSLRSPCRMPRAWMAAYASRMLCLWASASSRHKNDDSLRRGRKELGLAVRGRDGFARIRRHDGPVLPV